MFSNKKLLLILLILILISIVRSNSIGNCNPKYCLSIKCPRGLAAVRYPYKCCPQCISLKESDNDFRNCPTKFDCRSDEKHGTDGSSSCPNCCIKK